MKISRTLFKKKKLTDKFTFWEWFHSMMLLTEQYLEPIWKQGYVLGFISKLQAEAILNDKPHGTFLLRFSDSTLGGVTIGSKLPESDQISKHFFAKLGYVPKLDELGRN